MIFRFKIYDTRALQHPKPLEIMTSALINAHKGEILMMIHRREPFPLYDIIRAQGLEFKAFELCKKQSGQNSSQSCKDFANFFHFLAQNSADKKSQNDEFVLDDKQVKFSFKMACNFGQNSHENAINSTEKQHLNGSENIAQNFENEKIFCIFIAQNAFFDDKKNLVNLRQIFENSFHLNFEKIRENERKFC